MQRWISVVCATVLTAGAFCAQAAEKSLYERLGGQPAVQAVASGLVDRILADNRVNKWFTHAAASKQNTDAYKAQLATFLCVGFGGPCKYTGPDMTMVHKGRSVTSEAFDAVVGDLVAELNELKVPAKEQREVMTIVGSLKPQIVQSGPLTQ